MSSTGFNDNVDRVSWPNQIRLMLELIRFSHTVFALPFALLSASLAWWAVGFSFIDLLGILLAMVFARSAAMAFNRLVDQEIDAKNPRTAGRHLPAGLVSRSSVILMTLISGVGFVASTAIFLLKVPANPWPLYLSVPVLLFLLGYSLSKRFTSLAHVWLGTALMLAPVAAWIAIRGPVEMPVPIFIGIVVLFWVTGFDILYACQDAEFDRQAGLHSVPARFGVRNSLRIAAGCHAVMWAFLVVLGIVSTELSTIYFVGIGLIGLLLIVQHRLVKPTDLSRVNQAFFQVNAVISIGLLLTVWLELAVKWVGR